MRRDAILTPDQFKRCLLSVSADKEYVDWLIGRTITDRDRSPCYKRLRNTFINRMRIDQMVNLKLPSPTWYASGGGHGR